MLTEYIFMQILKDILSVDNFYLAGMAEPNFVMAHPNIVMAEPKSGMAEPKLLGTN